jgi:hypothetical protein
MSTTVASLSGPGLAAAVVEVLVQTDQPLTLSQLRDRLRRHRGEGGAAGEVGAEDLRRGVEELAAQGRIHAWPAYRSKSPRYAARTMDEAARGVLGRLLAELAFTRAELVAALRREVAGLEAPRAGQLVDEVLAAGNVRKLPPRLGSNSHLLGTAHPRSYLAPLFAALGKSLARLLPRLESEGVPPERVLQEARALWQQTLEQVEQEQGQPGETAARGPAEGLAETLERLVPPGAAVPVRDLRRQAGEDVRPEDIDQALLRLAQEGRVELRTFTPTPEGGAEPPAQDVVTGPDGRRFDRVARRP